MTSRKGTGPKSPESIWVCEAAGPRLARKGPWWLHSCPSRNDQSSVVSPSSLHQAAGGILTTNCMLAYFSPLTAATSLLSFLMAPHWLPPFQTARQLYLTTCNMALLPHSSLPRSWMPVFSFKSWPPVWPHLWLLPQWGTFASFPYSLHYFSCHPQSGQAWLSDPGDTAFSGYDRSQYSQKVTSTLPWGGSTTINTGIKQANKFSL